MALLDRLKKVQLRIGLLFHCLLLSSNSFDDQQSDCFFFLSLFCNITINRILKRPLESSEIEILHNILHFVVFHLLTLLRTSQILLICAVAGLHRHLFGRILVVERVAVFVNCVVVLIFLGQSLVLIYRQWELY